MNNIEINLLAKLLLNKFNTTEEAVLFLKNFNSQTEGLPAFQQMSLENESKIGRDDKPIENKEETRLIKKDTFGPMAPKERLNEETDPIIGDKQSGDNKKNENAGIGSFSTPTQVGSELLNQQSHPEAVDSVKEIKKRTDVRNNSEPIFKGLDPNINDDEFYKSIDILNQTEEILQKSHLIGPEQKTPLGAKDLAEKLELNLYSSLRKTINNWYNNIEKDTNPDEALVLLKKEMLKWNNVVSKDTLNGMSDLLDKGIKAGIRKTKIPVDKKFYGQVNYSALSKKGIIPSIQNLSDEVFKKTSAAFRKHNTEKNGNFLYRQKREIDSNLKSLRPKTRLMLKTEMARYGNLGALTAFNQDPDKNFYKYFWDNVDDNRSKKISLIRKQGSPYSFSEISFLLKNQEQLIDNQYQNDSFNQRCSFSRGEKLEKEWIDDRFIGIEDQFKETV